MAISCSGFYTVALFSPRSTMLQSTLLWYLIFFVQSLGTLPWEITKYLIDNEHSDPIRMICMQAYRLLKKAARPGTWFLVAPTSISPWFLCPCPPLLLCTPTQNHHATQATFRWKANYVTCLETYKNTKTMHWSETWIILIYLVF